MKFILSLRVKKFKRRARKKDRFKTKPIELLPRCKMM